MLDSKSVERFAALFNGFSKAYGTSRLTGVVDERGKHKTDNSTIRATVTLHHYEMHLQGKTSLGIVALRDDDTCKFAAIDYDVYDSSIEKAEKKIQEKGLPLIPIRSKSGGIHLYCFFEQPISARIVLERLSEWASMLGMSSRIEKFPKQTSRFNDEDVGSYINLPYFHAENTTRKAYISGELRNLDYFLDYTETHLVPPDRASKSWLAEKSELFKDGPPCLQQLESQGGFIEGTRNDGMLAAVTYLKKAYPDSWKTMVDKYNSTLANLPSDEVQHIVKSAGRKNYNYRCKQAPINAYCQRALCMKRQFGVISGDHDDDYRQYDINALTRYDHGQGEEPVWAMEINGKRITMNTQSLYSYDSFNQQCMSQIGIVPFPNMSKKRWLPFLNKLIPGADVIQMPVEASPTGYLWEWIIKFCTQKVYANTKEEIMLGAKPYRDGDMVWFRISDLITFLNSHRIPYKNQQGISMLLNDKGAEKTFWNINKRGMNVWGLKIEMPEEFEEPVPKLKPIQEITPTEAF